MRVLGHPIHPILIVFPLGLFSTAVIFDVLFLLNAGAVFATVAYYMILAGVISGVVAELFGLIDWLPMAPNTRAKFIGAWHGVGNFVVVLMFAASAWLRAATPAFTPDTAALALSFGGAVLLMVTGWMGGELVYRMGVAVDEGANKNSPSSLTHKSAKSKGK